LSDAFTNELSTTLRWDRFGTYLLQHNIFPQKFVTAWSSQIFIYCICDRTLGRFDSDILTLGGTTGTLLP
jgi:hypothetical protein